MPASPDHGARLAAQIVALIETLEQSILRLLASRLKAGGDGDRWVMDRLAELQMVKARVRRMTGRALVDVPDEVARIVLDAYNTGQALAVADLDTAGIPAAAAADAVDAAHAAARSAMVQVESALSRVPDVAADTYRAAVLAGADAVTSGTSTRLQASQQVLDRLASQGITGFTDRAGRRWQLESYVEMAVRTVAGNAAITGHADALQAAGHDLVIVSDSPRECPLCRPFERQVLSLSGYVGQVIEAGPDGPVRVDVRASLDQARADGLFHPQCRHTLSLYQAGITKHGNATAEPARYDAGQRQRAIERNIRAWKRRRMAALTPQAEAKAAAKVREWQGIQRAHVDRHGLRRLPYREQVGTPDAPLAH